MRKITYKRLYIEPETFKSPLFKKGAFIINNSHLCHRILHVLRLKINNKLLLFDGQGREYLVIIKEINRFSVSFKIEQEFKISRVFDKDITGYFSFIKKSRFEWALEKLTEVGIEKIVPIICARTIVRLNKVPERFKKIIIEASEQCGRSFVPQIVNPLNFEQAIKETASLKKAVNILFDASGKKLSEYVFINKQKKFNIFVGPEGGFTPQELKLARLNNFKIVKLAESTLRSETAMIIGTYSILTLR